VVRAPKYTGRVLRPLPVTIASSWSRSRSSRANPHTSEFAAGVDQESDHGFVAPIDQGLALARLEQCGQLVVVEHRHRLIDRNREDARTTQSVFGQFRGFMRLGCTLGGSPGIFGVPNP
jgi:hypothetical protein